MKHEKVIKRDDGSQVKISVEFWADLFYERDEWRFIVYRRDGSRKKWKPPCDTDSYAIRKLSPDDRLKELRDKSLLLASVDEVQQAMLELWEMLKPGAIVNVDVQEGK